MSRSWLERGLWPASWIDHPDRPRESSSAALFQLEFSCPAPSATTIHVSADNRYRLFLNGMPLGRGPERSAPSHWCYESYRLDLPAGDHVLTAVTWWQAGDEAPCAQMTLRPGFLLAAEGAMQDLLSTGSGDWRCSLLEGISFLPASHAPWTGAKVRIDGHQYPWGWEQGRHGRWSRPVPVGPAMSAALKNEQPRGWLLTPAQLPPMREERVRAGRVRHISDAGRPYPLRREDHLEAEAADWQLMLDGDAPVTIPPRTARRLIIDLENYYCAFPEVTTSGGAGSTLRLLWAEALLEETVLSGYGYPKGNRDEIEGKSFLGVGDEFLPDGGSNRLFTTLWWETGRYLELTVTTGDEPLTLDALTLVETGYPYQVEHRFHSSDARLQAVIPTAFRALQMCSHETYMDCPWYEQLMYVGDTRLECLVTHILTRDDRLPRKALTLFDQSRLASGWTQSRFPSRILQVIPPFSFWYVCMAHDYWMWRDDSDFVRQLMPGIRGIAEAARRTLGDDGLLAAPNGWNFVDWVTGWDVQGMPCDADLGTSSIINLQFVLALLAKADMEDYFDEPALAERDRAAARRTFAAVLENFFSSHRGLIADDLARRHFSEHAQCLALISGLLPPDKLAVISGGLVSDPTLARTTVYFTHYLFEAYRILRRPDKIMERMQLWFDFGNHGFKTTPEMPEPSRSDCHAWGAHPVFHYSATLAGIRPAAPGFRKVRITPLPGSLDSLETVLPHPAGMLKVSLRRENGNLHAVVVLPDGVTGTLCGSGSVHPLSSGRSEITLQDEAQSLHA